MLWRFCFLSLVALSLAACGGNDPKDTGEGGNGGTGGAGGTGGTGGEIVEPECVRDAECDDGNACTYDTCELEKCVHREFGDEEIDDHNACTTDSCDPAVGVKHEPIDPDDGNACTVDSCDPDVGVVNRALTPADYDDHDPCTVDSCNPDTGVQHVAIDVNDGNPCTEDICDRATGEVINRPINIDDGDACTDDICDPSNGNVTHVPRNIDDEDHCTIDACNSETGQVSHLPVTLDDGNPCTVDACDPTTGHVTHERNNINDGNHCTIDRCDPLTGEETHVWVDVDDNDPCTVDSCNPETGNVIHEPIPVDDQNVCTEDLCVADDTAPNGYRVVNRPLAALDDHNACTLDRCTVGEDGKPVITHSQEELTGFDDHDPCTRDSCRIVNATPVHDHIPYTELEKDELACTVEVCIADPEAEKGYRIEYQQLPETILSDGFACTVDVCVEDSTTPTKYRIEHNPLPAEVLSDNDGCTEDICVEDPSQPNGYRIEHPDLDPASYADGLACTQDICVNDPTAPNGRRFEYPDVDDKDDGNACTVDVCVEDDGQPNGYRIDRTPVEMDDGNACTVDSCDPATGVHHEPVDPDDGNPCTNDSCDPATGTVNVLNNCMGLTLTGQDSLLAGHRGDVTLHASLPTDYPAASYLRWELTITDAAGLGVQGVRAYYFGGAAGEAADDPSTWVTYFETDEDGWAHFGSPAGFLAETTTLKDPNGETTEFQVVVPNAGDYDVVVTLQDLTLNRVVDQGAFEATVAPVTAAATIIYGGPATAEAGVRTGTTVTGSLNPSYPSTNLVRWRITVTRNGLPAANEVIYYTEDPSVTDHTLFTDSFTTDANGVTWFGPAAGMPASLLQADPIVSQFSVVGLPGVYETKVELVDFTAGNAVIGTTTYSITFGGDATVSFTAPATATAGVRTGFTVTAGLDAAYPATNNVIWKITIYRDGAPAAGQTIFYTEDPSVTDHALFTDSFATGPDGITWFGPAGGFPASQLQGAAVTTPFSIAATAGAYLTVVDLVDLTDGNKVIGSAMYRLTVTIPEP
jgi:hypothetical protein